MGPALSYDALRQVVIEQQAEAAKIGKQPWVERDALKQSERLLEESWIKIIKGIRRSGKSIFGHLLLRNKRYGYANFDDERFIGLTSAHLDKVLQFILEYMHEVDFLFFDEIQNISGWELFINRLQRQGYNIIITGSNSNLLAKELATHLIGRYVNIEIFPFSFAEFLRAKQLQWSPMDLYKTKERAILLSYLKKYLYQGGFPQLVTQGFHAEYLRELYDKIIFKDITSRYQIRLMRPLRELAIYCHANLGHKVTFQKLKDLFGLNSVHTVKNHFQYLDDGYLVFLLEPFDFGYKEHIKQSRKIYTIDNGLPASINPKFHNYAKENLENLVFQELRRRGKTFSQHDINGMEISFVLHELKEPNALIDVAWSSQDLLANKKTQKKLLKASEHLKTKDCTLVTWEDEGENTISNLKVRIVPIWKWLLAID